MGVLKVVVSVVWLGFLCASSPATAFEPERRGQENFLKRVAFAEHHLWALSDAGVLFSVEEGSDQRTRESTPELFVDICVQDGQLLAISTSNTLTLWRHTTGKWSIISEVPREQEMLVALNCSPKGISLLTTGRLIDLIEGHQHSVRLADKFPPGVISATFADEGGFFLGIDAGEWGGGLRRIDRLSGKITTIEKNSTGELCGGPLNASCDPVNGIVGDPWKPGCILAVVGLVHFAPHGRLVEVCGDTVQRLYVKPYGSTDARNGKSDEPFSTVAFFDLVRQGDAVWAAGIDGIYRFSDPHEPRILALPKFKNVGGISVSFDLPGIVLVLTEVNQRMSLSGATPLMAPR